MFYILSPVLCQFSDQVKLLGSSLTLIYGSSVCLSYLHNDLESIQGGRAGPGNSSSSSTCDQVPPPHPSLLLLNGELIRHHQVLTHIEYLPKRYTIDLYKRKKKRVGKHLFTIQTWRKIQVSVLRFNGPVLILNRVMI